jgi:hypothetical protein
LKELIFSKLNPKEKSKYMKLLLHQNSTQIVLRKFGVGWKEEDFEDFFLFVSEFKKLKVFSIESVGGFKLKNSSSFENFTLNCTQICWVKFFDMSGYLGIDDHSFYLVCKNLINLEILTVVANNLT